MTPARAALFVALMMPLAPQARAADITYASAAVNIIAISGTITPDDADKFAHIVPDPMKKTGVVLMSPGGNIVAALAIGEAIHRRGYGTLVPDGQVCASACGLIWLGGSTRMVSETARIGFHAAYIGHGPTASESGIGNAMVGAYLARIGLSYNAVAFLTSAAPNDMQWLHPNEARAIGIDFVTLAANPATDEAWSSPSRVTAVPAPQPAPAAAPAVTLDPSEEQARTNVLQWFHLWSTTGTDLGYLAQYYRDSVSYYGAATPRAKVLGQKQQFAARWPVRSYSVRAGSTSAVCSATCVVNGIVDWTVSSPERHERSIGSANFTLELAKGSLMILGENGSVITSHKEPLAAADAMVAVAVPPAASSLAPPGTPASPTIPAYNDGRAARLDYEQWFGSITDAEFKAGVTFWAANRSSKPTPSCKMMASNQLSYAGCIAAQERLAPIDTRRKAEPDFRTGWNSL